MSSFTYPGKDRLASRIRRLAGGALLLALLMAIVFAPKSLIDEQTVEVLLNLIHLSGFEHLSVFLLAWLLLFIGTSWLVSKWVLVEVLEFHLFPWFDEETLRPISEKTGLLRWVDFEDNPAHEASRRLRAWLLDGVHDGAWPISWMLRGRPALKEKAFSYALVLGPNGVGKSQLAREAAREKFGVRLRPGPAVPNRHLLDRSLQALDRWRLRVLPRMARLPDDPWHAGEIVPLPD